MKSVLVTLTTLLVTAQAGVAFATVPDPATSFEIRYESKGKALTTQLSLPIGGTRNYIVGNYNFEMRALDDKLATTSFVGYCVDPFQWANSSFHTYEATLLGDSLVPSRYEQVTKLFGHAYAASLTDATKAAGFQLALWEVFNDDGALDAGSVRVTGLTNNSVKAEAQSLLSGLPSWTDVGTPYELTFYRNDTFQDYVAVTGLLSPIPEPESYALLIVGLGLVGLVAGRRNNRHAA